MSSRVSRKKRITTNYTNFIINSIFLHFIIIILTKSSSNFLLMTTLLVRNINTLLNLNEIVN